jgi:hypothetical protein
MSVPVTGGTAVTSNTATASDTITTTQLGNQGVNLIVRTAGTINTITISDAGLSPAANAVTPVGVATVATGTKAFYISPAQATSAGFVTITSTPTTALTYEVYPA